MLDEVDDVAAPAAAAAIPDLFANVDAEAIGPAAGWTAASEFRAADTLEAGAEALRCREKVDLARPLDSVAKAHRTPRSRE